MCIEVLQAFTMLALNATGNHERSLIYRTASPVCFGMLTVIIILNPS